MKKLFLLILCALSILLSCSSDDHDLTVKSNDYPELYTGNYEWVATGTPFNNMSVVRFISQSKMYATDGSTLYGCFYYIRDDGNGGLECCVNAATINSNGEWEYFSTDESTWYTFKWNNSEHTSFSIRGTVYTKRAAETITINK